MARYFTHGQVLTVLNCPRLLGASIRKVASHTKEEGGTVMALVEAGQARLLVAWESGQLVLWDWQLDTTLATVSLFSQVSYGMVWWGLARESGQLVLGDWKLDTELFPCSAM